MNDFDETVLRGYASGRHGKSLILLLLWIAGWVLPVTLLKGLFWPSFISVLVGCVFFGAFIGSLFVIYNEETIRRDMGDEYYDANF